MTKKEKLFYMLTALLTFVTLCVTPLFNFYKERTVTEGDVEEYEIDGFSALFNSFSMSGFLFLACFLVIIGAVLYAVAATKKSEAVRATGLSVSLLTAMNFVYAVIAIKYVVEELEAFEKVTTPNYQYDASTMAYMPFVLSLMIFIAYALLSHLVMGKNECCCVEEKVAGEEVVIKKKKEQAKVSPRKEQPAPSSVEITATLIKYKNLLDQGAISQEEFDAIKAKLLNK